jgi:hypothetical protein
LFRPSGRPQALLRRSQLVYFFIEAAVAGGVLSAAYMQLQSNTEGRKRMKTYLATVLVGAAFAAVAGVAAAHHSFAMFDQEHPQEVTGIVKEFKYTSPHSFILLDIMDKDGKDEVWNLEGGSPSALARDGWTSKSLKAGDELRLTIEPLRSGAPGGAWNVNRIQFMDGKPIVPKTQ